MHTGITALALTTGGITGITILIVMIVRFATIAMIDMVVTLSLNIPGKAIRPGKSI